MGSATRCAACMREQQPRRTLMATGATVNPLLLAGSLLRSMQHTRRCLPPLRAPLAATRCRRWPARRPAAAAAVLTGADDCHLGSYLLQRHGGRSLQRAALSNGTGSVLGGLGWLQGGLVAAAVSVAAGGRSGAAGTGCDHADSSMGSWPASSHRSAQFGLMWRHPRRHSSVLCTAESLQRTQRHQRPAATLGRPPTFFSTHQRARKPAACPARTPSATPASLSVA